MKGEQNESQKEKKEEVLTVWLPLPDNIANDRKNHWKHYQLKQAYFEEASYLMKKWRKANRFSNVISCARYDVEVTVSKLMDFDNLVARLKWCLDSLVCDEDRSPYGIVFDDSPKHLWPRSLPRQVLDGTKKSLGVRFTLYPCESLSDIV